MLDSPHTYRPRRHRGSCCTCRKCRLELSPSAASGHQWWCSGGRRGYWRCERSRLERKQVRGRSINSQMTQHDQFKSNSHSPFSSGLSRNSRSNYLALSQLNHFLHQLAASCLCHLVLSRFCTAGLSELLC